MGCRPYLKCVTRPEVRDQRSPLLPGQAQHITLQSAVAGPPLPRPQLL